MALADLALLDIDTDAGTDRHAWHTTLELAQRRMLPLVSLDQDLRTAGAVLGLTLFGSAEA